MHKIALDNQYECGIMCALTKMSRREAILLRATIKLIAEKAGTSIGTVDRVIHNRPYVKAEIRERVLQIMEEMNYHPHQMANALAGNTIPRRFMVIQPEWEPYVWGELTEGVSKFRELRRDYNISVSEYSYGEEDTAGCLRLMDLAIEQKIDGVAMCASDCPEVRKKLHQMAEHHIPVVLFNSDIPHSDRLCYVGENGRHAGRIAAEIISKALRKEDKLLVVYAGPEYAGHIARAEGFKSRMEELNYPQEDCRVVATHNDYDKTYAAVCHALQEIPDLACIYMANLSVPACVDAIRDCGRAGTVRVLSHDAGTEIRQYLKEGSVDFTIDQNLGYQSYQALDILYKLVVEYKKPEAEFFYSRSSILNAVMV